MKKMKKSLIAILWVISLSSQAQADMEFSVNVTDGVQIVEISGEISDRTTIYNGEYVYVDFLKFKIFSSNIDRNIPTVFKIKSGGGYLNSAISLGLIVMVVQHEIQNAVGSNNVYAYIDAWCMSACLYLFMSFNNRIATSYARFGFHSPNRLGVIDTAWREDYLKFMKHTGVSSDWIESNRSIFETTSMTLFEAQELANQNSGFVNSENIIASKNDLIDFIKKKSTN